MARIYGMRLLHCVLSLCTVWVLVGTSYAGNDVLGEIHLNGATKVEKDSGVWIDGQYLGYLKELKRSKKILLLPGEHEIDVRQAGYKDFTQRVTVEPGVKQNLRVQMAKDQGVQYPRVTAEVKLVVVPDRAAVFVDGLLLGHASEFQGAGKALLVAPGKRRITISLPGYQTFETELDLAPHQKFKLATNLVWSGVVAENSAQ
jgi:PEGA domain